MFLHKLVILCVFFTTIHSSKVHEITLPSSKSVKIFEDDTSTPSEAVSEENFDQYALENFLNEYAQKFKKKQHPTTFKTNQESSTEKEEKSKRWNMMQVQKHKHPFEDKNGWVSLDPVPWSLSKISKWKSEKKPEHSYKPLEKPWEADLVTSEYDDVPSPKPSWYQKPRPYKVRPSFKPVQHEEDYYRPTIVVQEPEIQESSSPYDHKLQISYNTDDIDDERTKFYIKRPTSQRYPSKPHKNCDHSSEEILTDGQPSNFPSNRRKSSEIPENHPFSGNGDWILLSTTKGYKSPQNRQRSLQFTSNPISSSSEANRKSLQVIPNSLPTTKDVQNFPDLNQKEPDSVALRRGVHLTVLPPLKSSKVNMTTSHGGLLQVESTFETVEQSQQRHARKVKDNIRKKPLRTKIGKNKVVRRPAVQKLNVALPVTSLNERIGNPDISAVLAAAGAGMIPATMAMLVPMAMGGKRRRRRDLGQFRPFLS